MWSRRYKIVSSPTNINLACIALVSLKIGIFSKSTISYIYKRSFNFLHLSVFSTNISLKCAYFVSFAVSDSPVQMLETKKLLLQIAKKMPWSHQRSACHVDASLVCPVYYWG